MNGSEKNSVAICLITNRRLTGLKAVLCVRDLKIEKKRVTSL